MVVPSVVIAVNAPAWATEYLTVAQAQRLIFPDETFTPLPLSLSDEQRQGIKKLSGVSARKKEQRVWETSSGGYFIVDEVVGKHEFITYAVGIDENGKIRQIEIMDYRETYGDGIREATWRQQFVGKTSGAKLKLDEDIKNISGATLSCRHVTDGVKRIMAMYALVLRK